MSRPTTRNEQEFNELLTAYLLGLESLTSPPTTEVVQKAVSITIRAQWSCHTQTSSPLQSVIQAAL